MGWEQKISTKEPAGGRSSVTIQTARGEIVQVGFRSGPSTPLRRVLVECFLQVHRLQRVAAAKQDHIEHLNRQASLGFLREAREQVSDDIVSRP